MQSHLHNVEEAMYTYLVINAGYQHTFSPNLHYLLATCCHQFLLRQNLRPAGLGTDRDAEMVLDKRMREGCKQGKARERLKRRKQPPLMPLPGGHVLPGLAGTKC